MAAAGSATPELDFNAMTHEQQLTKLAAEKSQLDGWVEEIPEPGMKTIIKRINDFIKVLMNFTINIFSTINAMGQEIKDNKGEHDMLEANVKGISDLQDQHKDDIAAIRLQMSEIPIINQKLAGYMPMDWGAGIRGN